MTAILSLFGIAFAIAVIGCVDWVALARRIWSWLTRTSQPPERDPQ